MAIDLLSLYDPGRGEGSEEPVITAAGSAPADAAQGGLSTATDSPDLDDTLVMDSVPAGDVDTTIDEVFHSANHEAANHEAANHEAAHHDALRDPADQEQAAHEDVALLPALPMAPLELRLALSAITEAYETEVAAHTQTIEALHRARAQGLYAARCSARERSRRLDEQEHRFRDREKFGATIQRLNSDVAGLEEQLTITRSDRDRLHKRAITFGITTGIAIAGGMAGILTF